ncbi:ABC transporter permease [Parvularcula sp. IMCC14364]|uniref:ABC transporter permease n=1 Tax=Parvularcula sp. IMCC14364 TaxID=3067902 RepID=UPI00274287B6|nr:ABC transporter permease [Parvularcula sp. IMCC14364]
MSFGNAFLTALQALRLNGMRSLLTALGIIIGIASVIVMVAIGNGARQSVEEQIERLGSSMLTVFPSTRSSRGQSTGRYMPFSERIMNSVAEQLPDVVGVTGDISSQVTLVSADTDWATTARGVNATYPLVRNHDVADGDFFTPEDVASGKRYAVIGSTIQREVFGEISAVGASIRINNVPFEVIGVMEATGESFRGRDSDDVILAPLKTVRDRLAGNWRPVPDRIDSMYILFRKDADIEIAQSDLEEVLRYEREIKPGQSDNFRVLSFASFVQARNETSQTFSYLLAAAAGISLIVGGIGIMNIMLVSVTERTREIGLRMAIGARRGDIMTQFLIEAVVLCTIGGIIGLALGLGGAWAVTSMADWEVLIEPSLVVIAIATSLTVGVVFGFFPARQAAQLNPIEALRYE